VTLIYRARIDVGPARSAQDVERAFSDWLQHKRLRPALPVSGARRLPTGQEVYRASHAADGIEALRLSLLDVNKQGRWRTTCTAVRADGGPWQLVVDLDRTGAGPAPPPIAPVIVRTLLGEDSSSPAGTPLRAHAVPVSAGDAQVVLDAIHWPTRDVPVVVAYDDDADRVEALASTLAGVALVFRLLPGAPAAFNDAAGAGYRIRRGSWRTYLPGAGLEDDEPRRHRSLAAERIADHPDVAIRTIAGSLRSSSLAMTLPPLYLEQVADLPGFRSAERLVRREQIAAAPAHDQQADTAAVEEELIELVEGLERELDEQRAARRDHERQRDEALLDLALAAEELSRERGRVAHLERELATRDVRPWEITSPVLDESPIGFAELLEWAPERLPLLSLGQRTRACLELDDSARAATWVVKVWEGLLALQSFAEGRAAGFEGNFEQWCRETPPGGRAYPANSVAMTEHETVQGNKAMRSARTFAVPEAVEASGSVAMWAHIKIDNRDPAPRLHFHDDTRGTGQVYVGYVGGHLLSPKTS
jgi:hypothetical protein